jgi:hypothetical protein
MRACTKPYWPRSGRLLAQPEQVSQPQLDPAALVGVGDERGDGVGELGPG